MELGDLIKKYRDDQELSMDAFAKRSGLSKAYISLLENKINPRNNKPIVPTIETLRSVARGMDMDINQLIRLMDDQIVSLYEYTHGLFKDNLKKIRNERGLSRAEFSILLDVPEDKIAGYEDGLAVPFPGVIQKFANTLNVPFAYLRGNIPMPSMSVAAQYVGCAYDVAPADVRESVQAILEPYFPANYASFVNTRFDNVMELPLPLQRLGAGMGEPDNGSEEVEKITVRINEETRKADYVMQVNGDSMEPDYPDGCLVAVLTAGEIKYGEVGVFSLNGEQLIKIMDAKGLKSKNRKYEIIKIGEYDEFCCYGKVLGIVEQ